MNSQITGAVAELDFALEYTKRGYIVSFPQTPTSYDFVAEKGKVVKVQVKSGSSFNNGNELLVHSKSPVRETDFDILVVLDPIRDERYYIPVHHVAGMKNIRLRLDNKESEKTLLASHYKKFIG